MQTFPELDSSNFVNMSADAYSIHAEGGVVAFAVFNDLSDSFIMISDDAVTTGNTTSWRTSRWTCTRSTGLARQPRLRL